MSKFHRFCVSLSCTSLLFALASSVAYADDYRQQLQNEKLLKHELELQKRYRKQQYEDLV